MHGAGVGDVISKNYSNRGLVLCINNAPITAQCDESVHLIKEYFSRDIPVCPIFQYSK